MKSHPCQPCLCTWFTPGLKRVPETSLSSVLSPLPPLSKPLSLNQPSYLNRPSFLNQPSSLNQPSYFKPSYFNRPSYEPTFKNYYPFEQQKTRLVVDNNTCRCGHPRCCHSGYVGVNFNKNVGFK